MRLAGGWLLCLAGPFAYAQTETITITNGEWAPYLSEHLPHFGFASHVTSEAFKASGVKVSWGFMPWQRGITLAEHGTWDATIGWVKTPARAEVFHYTTPIMYQRRVMIQRKDNLFDWRTPDDLKDKRLGITIASGYPLIRPIIDSGKVMTLRFPTYQLAVRALLNKRVDGVPITRGVGQYLIENDLTAAEAAQLQLSKRIIETLPIFLLVSRKIKNGPTLIKKFNDGMEVLHATGRYGQMLTDLQNGAYDKRDK